MADYDPLTSLLDDATTEQAIRAACRTIEEPLTIVFSDNNYRNVLRNWLYGIQRLGVRNCLVISLDERIFAEMQRAEIPTILLPIAKNNLGALWTLRAQLFRQLARTGIDFIHSDADAVWLKNPIPDYLQRTAADIVMSQGTVWPHDVHARWNFVLCCGFFYVKASPRTEAFLDQLCQHIQQTEDDQMSFNRLLAEDEMQWEVSNPYTLRFRKQLLTCSRQCIDGVGRTLQVRVLPHHQFQRLHMPSEDAYVKHIFSDKTGASTEQVLRECGCYWLDASGSPPALSAIGAQDRQHKVLTRRAA